MSIAERQQMALHRSSCAECSVLNHQIERTNRIVGILRNDQPILDNPEAMTREILGRINNPDRLEMIFQKDMFAAFIDWLAIPMVRTALASLLLLLGVAFVFEYTSAFVRVKKLESQISAETKAAVINPTSLEQQAISVSGLLSGKQSYADVAGDWVLIRKSTIQDLTILFHELNTNAQKLPSGFHRTYPKISQLLSQRSTSTNIDDLLKDREKLIRELNALIPTGGNRP